MSHVESCLLWLSRSFERNTFSKALATNNARGNTCTKEVINNNNNKGDIRAINLHFRKLKRSCTSPQEHPIHEHPIFAKATQVKVTAACAILAGCKDFKMSSGYEAGMAHTHIHRALRRVPPNGYRALFHHIFEFTALEPGNSRPSQPAYHRHFLDKCYNFREIINLTSVPRCPRMSFIWYR